jgi:hypothetical protein
VSVLSVSVPVTKRRINRLSYPGSTLPLDVLPLVLQDFIAQTAASLPVPVDLVAAPVLACLGAAIGCTPGNPPQSELNDNNSLVYLLCG